MMDDIFPPGLHIKDSSITLETLNLHAIGWDIHFLKIGKEDLKVTLHAFHTPHIQLSTAYFSDAYLLQGNSPENAVLLSYIHSKEITNFRHSKVKENELILSRHENNFDLLTSGASTNYAIVIDEGLFANFFELFFECSYHASIEKIQFYIEEEQTKAFIDTMKGWLHFTVNAKELRFSTREYLSLERQILLSLFPYLRIRTYQHNANNVEKARALLEENLKSTYYMTDLVEELRVNERSLQNSFKSHLGISAKHYLTQLRLNAIREELLRHEDSHENIQEIARRYNFFHMGHFSKAYKEIFSETPSETIQNS